MRTKEIIGFFLLTAGMLIVTSDYRPNNRQPNSDEVISVRKAHSNFLDAEPTVSDRKILYEACVRRGDCANSCPTRNHGFERIDEEKCPSVGSHLQSLCTCYE